MIEIGPPQSFIARIKVVSEDEKRRKKGTAGAY
jgi:hypothetical protein